MKLSKKLGRQPKIWGAMAHPGPPLESPLTADINSAMVPAMLCSPTLCRYTYLSILLRNEGPYFVICSKRVYSSKQQHHSLVKIQTLQLQLGF